MKPTITDYDFKLGTLRVSIATRDAIEAVRVLDRIIDALRDGTQAPLSDPLALATRPEGTVSRARAEIEDLAREVGGTVIATPSGPYVVDASGTPDTEEAPTPPVTPPATPPPPPPPISEIVGTGKPGKGGRARKLPPLREVPPPAPAPEPEVRAAPIDDSDLDGCTDTVERVEGLPGEPQDPPVLAPEPTLPEMLGLATTLREFVATLGSAGYVSPSEIVAWIEQHRADYPMLAGVTNLTARAERIAASLGYTG